MIALTSLEPGTWTELVVGGGNVLVALVLGLFAIRQARAAGTWAKVAAEAQQHANELAEAALRVEFRAKFEVELYHTNPGEGRGQPYDAWLFLEVPTGSASVWLHRAETAFAFFGLRNGTWVGDLTGGSALTPLNMTILPKLLHPGENVQFQNPWSHFSPVRTDKGYAHLKVCFSATRHAPLRWVEVAVDVPPPLASTWQELATKSSPDSRPAESQPPD